MSPSLHAAAPAACRSLSCRRGERGRSRHLRGLCSVFVTPQGRRLTTQGGRADEKPSVTCFPRGKGDSAWQRRASAREDAEGRAGTSWEAEREAAATRMLRGRAGVGGCQAHEGVHHAQPLSDAVRACVPRVSRRPELQVTPPRAPGHASAIGGGEVLARPAAALPPPAYSAGHVAINVSLVGARHWEFAPYDSCCGVSSARGRDGTAWPRHTA